MGGGKRMKDVLMIGASSDVGTELIKHLGSKNISIRIFAHYNSSDENIKAAAEAFPCMELHTFKADLRDISQTQKLADELKEEGCAPEAFIYLPAPPFSYLRIKEYTPGCLDAAFCVGAESYLCLCREFLPVMKKSGGRVIVMLSSYVTDEMPPRFMSDYITGKYALLGAMKASAAEYGSAALKINAVAPEMMDTAFLDGIDPRIREMNIAQAPAGRLLLPADIMGAFDELLSPECELNGAVRRISL